MDPWYASTMSNNDDEPKKPHGDDKPWNKPTPKDLDKILAALKRDPRSKNDPSKKPEK